MTRDDADVLDAVRHLSHPYGISIQDYLNAGRSRWRRWGLGAVYQRLWRLEETGYLFAEWSSETFPNRNNRRRRYYYLTEKSLTALAHELRTFTRSERVCNRIRAIWRYSFKPEPPARLDGMIVQFRTTMSCFARGESAIGSTYREEWERQLIMRGRENQAREDAWKRGEPIQ
jgi:DNA-binding PadR family transcriptional regulator